MDACRLVRSCRQVIPRLLGGVRNDRGQQPGQVVVQPGQDELGGSTVGAVGGLGIKAVLEHVEVEARKLDRDELVDPLIDPVELEPLVSGCDVADHLVELAQSPEIDLVQRGWIDTRRVEPGVVFEVAQQVAESIADLAIRLPTSP